MEGGGEGGEEVGLVVVALVGGGELCNECEDVGPGAHLAVAG